MDIEVLGRRLKVFSARRIWGAALLGLLIELLAHRRYYFNFILTSLEQNDPTVPSVMRTFQEQLNSFFAHPLFGRAVLGLVWAVIGGISCYIIWAVANTTIAIKNARIMMDSYANRATNREIIAEAALKVLSLSAPWIWLLIISLAIHPFLLGWSERFLKEPGFIPNWLFIVWALSGLASTMYVFIWLMMSMRRAFRPD